MRLPEAGYETRKFDLRTANIGFGFYDYSSDLADPIMRRLSRRFRLERVDPTTPSGPAIKPIVFYVDPWAPEEIRKALIEGASWWEEGFEAGGGLRGGLRFLFASRPEIMGRVLGIIYRVIATHLVRKADYTHNTARTGAVTLIQRFGSALNLNVHFYMLFLDGVYVDTRLGAARFRWVQAPSSAELTQLAHTIAHRVGRFLERQGLLERDMENSYLAGDAVADDPMTQLLGSSITYRIAVDPQVGRKVFTLQTLPGSDEPFDDGIGKVAGFSLHAGVAARADERKKLERLCRYIIRPAVSEKRLSLTPNGNIRYQLKTPYRDGTTHVIFEPLDFIARLAALVPKPRVNLTRFHGVFAPNSRHRALVTPAKRDRGKKAMVTGEPPTPAERRAAMTWAQRLKRVFNIDIATCSACGGAVKVIACPKTRW